MIRYINQHLKTIAEQCKWMADFGCRRRERLVQEMHAIEAKMERTEERIAMHKLQCQQQIQRLEASRERDNHRLQTVEEQHRRHEEKIDSRREQAETALNALRRMGTEGIDLEEREQRIRETFFDD